MAHFGLSAGGTGGHLFPAIAVAHELRKKGHQVSLFCDLRVDHLQDEGVFDHLVALPSRSPSSGHPLKKIMSIIGIARSAFKAKAKIDSLGIDAMIGFGGYPTVAPLMGAHIAKKPILVHEGNAVLGRANKMLANYATKIATHFDGAKYLPEDSPKHIVTGMPVRPPILENATAKMNEDLSKPLELLVFGGSLGARFFSDFLPKLMGELTEQERAKIRVTQQCREEDLERLQLAYRNLDERWSQTVTLSNFYTDMSERIAKADLVICRSGASTIAELAVIGRPAIFVPLPGSLDQDQLHNAQKMLEAGGGWIAPEDEIDAREIANRLRTGLKDRSILIEAGQRALLIAHTQAANKVADEAEKLLFN